VPNDFFCRKTSVSFGLLLTTPQQLKNQSNFLLLFTAKSRTTPTHPKRERERKREKERDKKAGGILNWKKEKTSEEVRSVK
jgi:hypothetical protein